MVTIVCIRAENTYISDDLNALPAPQIQLQYHFQDTKRNNIKPCQVHRGDRPHHRNMGRCPTRSVVEDPTTELSLHLVSICLARDSRVAY